MIMLSLLWFRTYVNAVLKGFDEFPEIDSTVREDVTDNYEKLYCLFTRTIKNTRS
jgi:hypothetical protein